MDSILKEIPLETVPIEGLFEDLLSYFQDDSGISLNTNDSCKSSPSHSSNSSSTQPSPIYSSNSSSTQSSSTQTQPKLDSPNIKEFLKELDTISTELVHYTKMRRGFRVKRKLFPDDEDECPPLKRCKTYHTESPDQSCDVIFDELTWMTDCRC